MVTVALSGPLEFEVASYGDSVARDTQSDAIPIDAMVTASIKPSSTPFSITSVTAYDVALVPMVVPPGYVGPPPKRRVYSEVAHSDGKSPIKVLKSQVLTVTIELVVPMYAVTPGDVMATLSVQGDSWDTAAEVPLRATLLAVDEATPIGEKWRDLGGLAFSGAVLANAQTMPDTLGASQTFANGAIVYSPDFGAAWLVESVYAKLNAPEVTEGQTADGEHINDYLGYPTGDTLPTIEPGGQAAIFERGIIVVRASGEAFVVYGSIYVHYTNLGSIAAGAYRVPVVGLPLSDEEAVPDGRRSRFEGGEIYSKSATGAWEVHGAIREAWEAQGGVSSVLGYPTSDEVGVMSGPAEIGRSNTFENGTMFWSAATGAFECHGEILARYRTSGGPAGALGFPTTNETDTPSGGRYNAFQNGFIVWHGTGTYAGAFTVGNSLQLQLYSFQDASHDNFNVQVHVDDSRGQKIRVRMPGGGEFGNGNKQFDPPTVLVAAGLTSDYTIDVWMEAISENLIGDDDRDGTVTAHFGIDNLWGTADSPQYANGGFHVYMKPMPQPQIFESDAAHFRKNLFWPFHNWKTPALTWSQFSQSYTNVGEGDLAFNVLPWAWHLWERAFFELIYRYLAQHGNCFGMCLESLYARENRAPFVEPIYDSPDNTFSVDPKGTRPDPASANNTAVIDRVNVKMGYQFGADFASWSIGMETANEVQDAVLAFKSSRDSYANGNWPIIMLSSDGLAFDGHAVVPYEWLVSFDGAQPIEATDEAINSQPLPVQTWIIRVANPNAPPEGSPDGSRDGWPDNDPLCEIRISPFENSWSFITGSDGVSWSGSRGSGGRIYSAPFSLLSYEQQMIGNFVVALIYGSMYIIFSGDGETQQITDEAGRTYFVRGEREPLSAITSTTRPPREINHARTRIPEIGSVPAFRATRDETPPRYEIFGIRRPAPAMRWPRPGSRQVAPRSQGVLIATKKMLFESMQGKRELIFRLAVARASPYRWNLNAPRMSIDIVCVRPADAIDEVRITGAGSAAQSITLRTDPVATQREFEITIAGWPRHDRKGNRAFSLKQLPLAPGNAVSVGVSDGGRELWLHNPGTTVTCLVDVFAPELARPLIANNSLTLPAGATMRVRPSRWTLEQGAPKLCLESIDDLMQDGYQGQDPESKEDTSIQDGRPHSRHERGEHLTLTGKIVGLMFDHFGDFEGFILEDDVGERRFFSRTKEIQVLAERAWKESLRITVIAERGTPEHPRKVIVRQRPMPFDH
ncbi:hypothetical protein [Paraburkholderia sp. J8-2]|uniref:LGFP repeat-containing protein n=1 Tax=Paraburkholderia sp. J8-2 TaxID=2805440 RepID=UPI002AB6ECEF|nr:hypothetical protein [Paraburkholderia sp. J8-2]